MSIVDDIRSSHSLVQHVLASVPFNKKNEQRPNFMDVYQILPEDMAAIDFSESAWDQRFVLSVNKLLKLGVSFGNLLKTYENDKRATEAKEARDAQLAKGKPPTQRVDPFSDGYDAHKNDDVQIYNVRFAQNLFHILKNFDIGGVPHSQRSKSVVDNDQNSTNGSQTSQNGAVSSPIKLTSRQLLIEKLEINISLDALFTYKVVLLLLLRIYDILENSLREFSDEQIDHTTSKSDADTSSMFSYASLNSSGTPPSQFVSSTDDYIRLVRAVMRRVDAGLVGPFVQTLVTELVDTNVAASFQALATNF
ncbi:hypothetical protein CJI97_003557 [Candidozyma auris]|nr:hypothetical protein CJI97_003557 [[Candida] auris]PSK78450.1 hypothetical protein CJJ07_001722 [[Candida] auris]QEL58580.1 hypothetical protein CJJ09_000623 [[Candida] auris]